MAITIAPVLEDRRDDAIELAVLCFGEDYRNAAIKDFGAAYKEALYQPRTLGAWDGEKLIGLIQGMNALTYGNVECLAWLCVHPDYRGRDIAKTILKAAEDRAIRDRFHDKPGSFILSADTGPAYYNALGYEGSLMHHGDVAYMIKIYRP